MTGSADPCRETHVQPGDPWEGMAEPCPTCGHPNSMHPSRWNLGVESCQGCRSEPSSMAVTSVEPLSVALNPDGTTSLRVRGVLADGRSFEGDLPGSWSVVEPGK